MNEFDKCKYFHNLITFESEHTLGIIVYGSVVMMQ